MTRVHTGRGAGAVVAAVLVLVDLVVMLDVMSSGAPALNSHENTGLAKVPVKLPFPERANRSSAV
jgi:hypothetical protein